VLNWIAGRYNIAEISAPFADICIGGLLKMRSFCFPAVFCIPIVLAACAGQPPRWTPEAVATPETPPAGIEKAAPLRERAEGALLERRGIALESDWDEL